MSNPRFKFLSAALFLLAGAAAQDDKIRTGPWAVGRVPEGWVVHNTEHYHVQSQCGIEKAKRLAAHMEAMNKTYRSLFKPDKGGEKPQTIKLFKDNKEYLKYAGQFGIGAGAAAYYASSLREMVCYDTGKWMDVAPAPAPVQTPLTGTGGKPVEGSPEEALAKAREQLLKRLQKRDDLWKMDLLGCAAHEGWHQYFHWYVTSDVELPSWVNEGMGDYFYTAVPKGKAGSKREPSKLGGTNAGRLMIAQAALRQDRFVPAQDLIRYEKSEYYANPSICYAEGWSLCQFLLHGGNPKYTKLIPTFIRLVKDDTNMEKVREKVFKGIDLFQLDKEFREWLKTQKSPEEEALGDEGEGEGPGGEEGKGGGEGKGGD